MPVDPQRGEIWLVDFEPTRGAEMRKTRPAVVVSSPDVGRLPLRLVIPLTTWTEAYGRLPWLVPIAPSSQNGLSRPSGADSFQIRSVSIERMRSRVGSIHPSILNSIMAAILLCIGYEGAGDPGV